MAKPVRLTLEYWRDADWYVGRVRELPGVFSQGRTLAELEDNIQDAYALMRSAQEPPAAGDVQTKEIALLV
jgi:predicted RNase H-like HicB family nuclease